MRSVAVVTTVTSQSEDPGVKCLCGPGASIVLPVFCVVLSSFLPPLWHAFGGEVNWLLTSGVKDSACWLWQSLSNLVWCRCSVSPPADQTSVIRRRDARTFNNRSFSLSLWVECERECVRAWLNHLSTSGRVYVDYTSFTALLRFCLRPPDAQDQEENQPPQWQTTNAALLKEAESSKELEFPSICLSLVGDKGENKQLQGQEVKEGMEADTGKSLGLSSQTQGLSTAWTPNRWQVKLDPVLRESNWSRSSRQSLWEDTDAA